MPNSSPVQLLRVPYDSGRRAERMGAGPDVLAPAVATELRALGRDVADDTIDAPDGFHLEAGTGIALARAIATRVDHACRAGRRPLVFSGNCLSSLGTVSGVRAAASSNDDDLAVIWFDAHGDLETPDSTPSGFVDGMALTTLMGRTWRGLSATVPGFRATAGQRVVLVGARDVSDDERALAADAGVTLVPADAPPNVIDQALDALVRNGARRAYVHVDLDVHEPAELPANSYPVPGGLSAERVRDVVRRVRERLDIAAAAFTAYDPSCDPNAAALPIVRALAALLVS